MKYLQRKEAIRLRQEGLSLSEISTELGVSKSSVSLWVRSIILDTEARKSIEKKRFEARKRAGQTNRGKRLARLEVAHEYAESAVANTELNTGSRLLLCSFLYFCEGARMRGKSSFAFTNSNPKLVMLYLKLLRESFDIDERKFRVTVHLHEYHDEKLQLQFWSKATTIPLAQFYKPYRKPHTAVRVREDYPGCVSIGYMDIDIGRKIEAIAHEFIKSEGL